MFLCNMRSLVDVLIYTGGHPTLRKEILHFLRTMNLQNGDDITSVKAAFLLLKTYLESDDREEGTYRLYKAVESYVYGDGDPGELDKIYRDHVKILGAGSSALIENLDPGVSPTPTPEPKKLLTFHNVILVILLYIVTHVKMLGRKKDGAFIGPVLPPSQQYPFEVFPPVNGATGTVNERIRRTLYMSTSALKNSRQLIVNPYRDYGSQTVTEIYDDKLIEYRDFTGYKIRFSGDGFEDYAFHFEGDLNMESKQVIFALREWIQYTMQAVDPIYRLSSNRRLSILVGPPPEKHPGVAGLMQWISQTLWIKYYPPGEGDMAHSFIHEYAHLIHLHGDDVASDCPSGICKNNRVFWLPPHDVMRWKDKVDTVLSLGIELDDLSYEEAVALNKDILDIRISEIYEKSLTRPVYSWHVENGAYAMKNHEEFWAEACASYLIGIPFNEMRFPTTADIKEGDPELFALLEEVWTNKGKNWS